jgi:hypothetical protein
LKAELFLEKKSKKFHFQEMDWIISFPNSGNQGKKYLHYSVLFADRKKGSLQAQVCLADVLEKPEFEKYLPHTVGFFKESIMGNDANVGSVYLEIRIIRSAEEFWKFLNDLDI